MNFIKSIFEGLGGVLYYLALLFVSPFYPLKGALLRFWNFSKHDLQERFLTYETAKGIYLLTGGIGCMWTLLYAIQYSTYALGGVIAWYLICEGLRKIFVNRTKQAFKRDVLLKSRKWERPYAYTKR